MYWVINEDCRTALAKLPEKSVHCVVTSPPYFGLRDYGVADQIGLEETPQQYVDEMARVFEAVRRVLREDGTVWLNLGDSYVRDAGKGQHKPGDAGKQNYIIERGGGRSAATVNLKSETRGSSDGAVGRGDRAGVLNGADGLKPKDLIGIPWRVAFALQAKGWYLRQDIIWAKPNPMPESVRDRCTKSHEYLFLLSKSPKYYFDAKAIAQPVAESSKQRLSQPTLEQQTGSSRVPGKTNGNMKAVGNKTHRNERSVWTIATQPFKEAHFATFPPALIEPCILAGCPEGGFVLDPFAGAGTTGLVAERNKRNSILIELNSSYVEMIHRRLAT